MQAVHVITQGSLEEAICYIHDSVNSAENSLQQRGTPHNGDLPTHMQASHLPLLSVDTQPGLSCVVCNSHSKI